MNRSTRGRRKPGKPAAVQATQPLKAAKRKIRVTEAIRVADMAHQMGLKANEIIKVLFGLGVMATINQSLDIDTATLVAAEFDYEVEKAGFSEEDYLLPQQEDKPEDLKPRPRSSPSWATWTTARPRCWTPSASPTSPAAKPAASPSTSVPTM